MIGILVIAQIVLLQLLFQPIFVLSVRCALGGREKERREKEERRGFSSPADLECNFRVNFIAFIVVQPEPLCVDEIGRPDVGE
mgnify:CR=1 FL=1